MYYISGPFYGKYNLVAPSGYCNWREQTCDYNYNIITIIINYFILIIIVIKYLLKK